MYNPMQAQYNSLLQQEQNIQERKRMIENQMNQYQMPPININNQVVPNAGAFDFNGRWVSDENEAKGVANNNLPLILFDRNNPVFYMKNMDGSFKKFHFEEIMEEKTNGPDDRIEALESKMNMILDALNPKAEGSDEE